MAPDDHRPRRRWQPIWTAHLAMGVLFLTWLAFAVVTHDDPAGRPQVLDVLLGSIGGVWFGMIVRDSGRKDEATADTAVRAEAKADKALEANENNTGGGG